METKEVGIYTIQVMPDETPDSPRNWDNLGTMVCFHSRYDLGDEHNYRHADYQSWDEMKTAISKEEDVAVILPIYLYDHSGITIGTAPFHCPWDSGQVGFIFVSKAKAREEYGYQRVSRKLKEKLTEYLKSEVKTYDQYLIGDVYGYRITKDGEEVDSCWGFYGSENCMEEAESIAKYMVAKCD